jgi:hypothetical protein
MPQVQYPPAPEAGQRYTDEMGNHWLIRSITRAQGFDGFYAVVLAHGPTLDELPDITVLGPREFLTFVADNGLTPTTASDAAQ